MTRRPEKPHLEWKMVRGRLTPRHRVTWTEGGKRREKVVTLEWNDDPQELDRLYWQCERGEHSSQKPKASTMSWKALVVAWRKDQRIQKKLADSTKASYRRTMDALLEKNADKDVRDTTRQHVRAIHDRLADKPRKADHMLQVIRLLWNFGREVLDWPLGENPASAIELYGSQREFLPWPEWMVSAIHSAPIDVQTTVELILGTGQRPNAAINMRHDDFAGEEMEVMDEKGRQRWKVYCPSRLRSFIASQPKRGAYVLAKNLTQAKGYDAIENQFRRWRTSLGDHARPYSLHGLRKLAIIELAEAGCADAEIQAVTGQSSKMVAYYRKLASKGKLSRMAQQRRDQNRNET
jgi:hypothetical protein